MSEEKDNPIPEINNQIVLKKSFGKIGHTMFGQTTVTDLANNNNNNMKKPIIVVGSGDFGIYSKILHHLRPHNDMAPIVFAQYENNKLTYPDFQLQGKIAESGHKNINDILANPEFNELILSMGMNMPLHLTATPEQRYGKIIVADDSFEDYKNIINQESNINDLFKHRPLHYLEPIDTKVDSIIKELRNNKKCSRGTPNKQILEQSEKDYKRLKELALAKPFGSKLFEFEDGFTCYARNETNANRKHKNHLKTINNKN